MDLGSKRGWPSTKFYRALTGTPLVGALKGTTEGTFLHPGSQSRARPHIPSPSPDSLLPQLSGKPRHPRLPKALNLKASPRNRRKPHPPFLLGADTRDTETPAPGSFGLWGSTLVSPCTLRRNPALGDGNPATSVARQLEVGILSHQGGFRCVDVGGPFSIQKPIGKPRTPTSRKPRTLEPIALAGMEPEDPKTPKHTLREASNPTQRPPV